MIGQLIDGRYEVEELAGKGGMSSVYRARDRVLGRRVALKILHEHFSTDDEYVERFRREARAIARLNHPNIVTVIDRGEFEGRQFIVFEHVPGENLKDVVRRHGPLPVPQAVALTHQVARALAFAHEHGIVHRDVKPQNVLLDENGSPKVTDFGIARSLDPKEGLTETGTLLGTSDYIAPEQASGKRVDERSDQYSLGVLLYELLTGEVPYPSETFMAAAMRHLNDPVPSVRERRRDVPAEVDAIIARAMAKDPNNRFPSTGAMEAALQAALVDAGPADEGATGVISRAPAPAARPRRRPKQRPSRRGLSPLLLGGLVLVAGALALYFLVGRSDGDGGGAVGSVRLTALRDYDPEGDDAEHPEDVANATDGDPATFWTTETYEAFAKSGVGLMLDARERVGIDRLEIVTDEPGFTAEIRVGESPTGRFVPFSERQEVGARTTFELAGGASYRYYLIWITDPNTRAHINEVRAG
jgi:tRNA A-37 threonylcarbamoyl transferase component Bud32